MNISCSLNGRLWCKQDVDGCDKTTWYGTTGAGDEGTAVGRGHGGMAAEGQWGMTGT